MPFCPNIRPSPKDNKLHYSKPTCSSSFAISQPAAISNGHFCSADCCWSHERCYQAADPPGWMTWTPWQQPERGSRHKTLMSYSVSVWRLTSPRARRWWGLHHSGLTGTMASFCRAVTECADLCGAVKRSRLFHQAPEVYTGRQASGKNTQATTYKNSMACTLCFLVFRKFALSH